MTPTASAGRFGPFGGAYVAETLMPAIQELTAAWEAAWADESFQADFRDLLVRVAGRPTPLYLAERLTRHVGGARILLKREDLLHTGAHKINNCLGQGLLAQRMSKGRIIAETGAGQHGVATATVAALMGVPCVVYMGSEDIERQRLNVFRMELLGAEVRPVEGGTRTLKDAMNEAMRDWVTHVEDTFYMIGSVAGPHPYPIMVREFQKVIGEEARRDCLSEYGKLPEALVACVGGGSNAMGLFHAFLDDPCTIHGVEAAGEGLETDRHAATLVAGSPGVLHGSHTYVLQDAHGQTMGTHSISAGLDYPGVGPEHAWLKESGRVNYVAATDAEALEAFQILCRLEGILPALESSHAIAHAMQVAAKLPADDIVLVNLSGRGDKDTWSVARALGRDSDGD